MGKPPKPLKKPRKNFPLTAHQTGYWVKKIKCGGKYKTHYIGPRYCSASVAEAIWNRDKEALLNGQDPADFYDADNGNGYTLGTLSDDLKVFKLEAIADEELRTCTLNDYMRACNRLIDFFGADRTIESLTTGDFDRLRKSIGKLKNGKPAAPVTINNYMRNIKVVLNYAYKADKIETPVKFGLKFTQVVASKVRKHQNKKPKKLFSVEHLKAVLNAASDSPQMRAMILLGINCGFGNADVGSILFHEIDFKTGWYDSDRSKTAIMRRGWLWPETVAAIKVWTYEREEAQARRVERGSSNTERFEKNKAYVFLTRYGYPWYRDESYNPLSRAFGKLSIPDEFPTLGFYCLRHSFATIGAETDSQIAVDHIMGHTKSDMPSHYRQQVNDKHLQAVAKHVRKHYKAALKS
jgi:integrase